MKYYMFDRHKVKWYSKSVFRIKDNEIYVYDRFFKQWLKFNELGTQYQRSNMHEITEGDALLELL